MSLRDDLRNNLQSAMKARDELTVSTIRLALSAVRNSEIEKGRELTDEEVVEVLSREVKKRREAIEGAEKAGRPEIAEKESKELEVLSSYLPEQLCEEEIVSIVSQVVAELGASSIKDRGRVMSVLMQRIKGRADGRTASRIVEQILQN